MEINIYPGDKVRVWCMNCSKWVSLEVPDRCLACQVRREGILDQAEPGIDFDCPEWLARQARIHPAEVKEPRLYQTVKEKEDLEATAKKYGIKS